jgi:hypothetical protein
VFPLGNIAAWHVYEGWVGIYDACIHKILQRNQMLFKTSVFNPSATESQSRVIVLNMSKKSLGFRVSDWGWLSVKILHVMTAVKVIYYISSKRLL